MNSIGISIAPHKGVIYPSMHLHLNIWKPLHESFCSREIFYLDIGILTKFYIDKIKVYLPFELSEKYQILDLAHILIENKPILCSLFNEDYNIKRIKSGCYHLVSATESDKNKKTTGCCITESINKLIKNIKGDDLDKTVQIICAPKETPESFYLYPLGTNDISVEKCKDAEGSILSIAIPNQERLNDEEDYYIRFRVPLKNSKGLALKTDLSNNLIQSAFTRLDMYNIQINEKREIPYGPMGILISENFTLATFSKIHILYIANPKVWIDNDGGKRSYTRIIEMEKWQPYLPETYSTDTYLAHHWKFFMKGEDCLKKATLYFSARYPKIQTATMFAYLFMVLILGCTGSLLATWLYDPDKSDVNIWALVLIGAMYIYIIAWYVITNYIIRIEARRRSTVKK